MRDQLVHCPYRVTCFRRLMAPELQCLCSPLTHWFLRRDTNNMEVASIVISAGVVGVQRVRNLDPPIMAVFQRNPVS